MNDVHPCALPQCQRAAARDHVLCERHVSLLDAELATGLQRTWRGYELSHSTADAKAYTAWLHRAVQMMEPLAPASGPVQLRLVK